MKKYLLSFLIIMGFVFCQSDAPVVQVGFESVNLNLLIIPAQLAA